MGVAEAGNLGSFVAPATFGFLEQSTGSIQGGLYGLAGTSVIAGSLVFFARTLPKPGAAVITTTPTASASTLGKSH
jgi:nitrate/nitrite transporter NarK